MKIGIIDFGAGNLFSLSSALKRLGQDYLISSQEKELENCTALILPGVGAFKDAITALATSGLADFIHKQARQGKEILGICLGMQLLFEESFEYGRSKGLSLLLGRIVKIPSGVKIPHMGWNSLEISDKWTAGKEFAKLYVYFVHSYYAETEKEYVLASVKHGIEIPAIVGSNNITGMQFHPEKSGAAGEALLRAWLEKSKKESGENGF